MRLRPVVLAVVLALLPLCGHLWADATTDVDAQAVVTGWLKIDPEPLGTPLGRAISVVETFPDAGGQPAYYVVHLKPAGFVVVPADDQVEPIIAFADEGLYNPSGSSPIATIVTRDISERLAVIGAKQTGFHVQQRSQGEANREKWRTLEAAATETRGEISVASRESISDVWVAPLTKTKWGQGSIACSPQDKPCYNYFTDNHYLCGCVATAMAQLMYYHRYPTDYHWNQMALAPNCDTNDTTLQAIGDLCYDAAESADMEYGEEASSASLEDAVPALLNVFKYQNAVYGCKYNVFKYQNAVYGCK